MWTVRRVKDGEVHTGRTRVQEPVANDSYDALVTAHARGLGAVSRSIAEMIRSSRAKDVAATATGTTR
jgi:uncharacterized lipoprotein YmbA